MCYVDVTGKLVIGNDVSITHGTSIMSTMHNYKGTNLLLIKNQETRLLGTKICHNI